MTDLVLSAALTTKSAAVRNALSGLGSLIELRPDTLELIERGLSVQRYIDAVATDLEVAEVLEIDSADMLEEAALLCGRLATVCADTGVIEKERKALTSPWNDLVKAINAGYNEPREHIAAILRRVQTKMTAWTTEQRRIAAAKEEAERKTRDEAAAAARRKEQEAQQAAQKLIDEANQQAAAGNAAKAAETVAQAQAVVDAAHAEAAHAAVVASRAFAPLPAKAKGTTETWDCEQTSLANLIVHVAARINQGDHSLESLLMVNMPAAKAKAKLEKTGFNVPGLRATSSDSIRTRKAAVAI